MRLDVGTAGQLVTFEVLLFHLENEDLPILRMIRPELVLGYHVLGSAFVSRPDGSERPSQAFRCYQCLLCHPGQSKLVSEACSTISRLANTHLTVSSCMLPMGATPFLLEIPVGVQSPGRRLIVIEPSVCRFAVPMVAGSCSGVMSWLLSFVRADASYNWSES